MNTERPLAFNMNRYLNCGSIAKNVVYELLTDLIDLAETTSNQEARDFLVDYSRDRMFSYYQAKEDIVVTPIFYGVRVRTNENEYMTVLFSQKKFAEYFLSDIQRELLHIDALFDQDISGAVHYHWKNTKLKKFKEYDIEYVHTKKQTPDFDYC